MGGAIFIFSHHPQSDRRYFERNGHNPKPKLDPIWLRSCLQKAIVAMPSMPIAVISQRKDHRNIKAPSVKEKKTAIEWGSVDVLKLSATATMLVVARRHQSKWHQPSKSFGNGHAAFFFSNSSHPILFFLIRSRCRCLEMKVQQYEKQGAKKAEPTIEDYGENGKEKTANEKISILCSSFTAYMADNFDVRASHALPISRFLVTYQKLSNEKEEEEKTAAAAVKANDEPS